MANYPRWMYCPFGHGDWRDTTNDTPLVDRWNDEKTTWEKVPNPWISPRPDVYVIMCCERCGKTKVKVKEGKRLEYLKLCLRGKVINPNP